MRNVFALILVAGIVAGASAQNVADYRYFKDEGIFDPGVSDATANSLVRDGIASEDPAVLDLTIRALGTYAMHSVNDLPTPYGSPHDRSFSAVPGLKPFLIDYWREQHRRSGHHALAAIQHGLGLEGADGLDGLTTTTLGLPEDASGDEIADAILARTPAWPMVPQILCALYPGDGDVLELLWEMGNSDVSPGTNVQTLGLLNVGRFATAEANAFRIDKLVSLGGSATDFVAVTFAAKGLALSRPLEAVPHLISAAFEHPSAREDILVVLGGYDDDVLSAYALEVAGLLEKVHLARPMGAVSEAVSRLETFTGGQKDAEPR